MLAKASAFDQFTQRRTGPLKPGQRSDYHVRFDRSYQGVPVVGGDIIVHLLSDGTLEGVTSSLQEPLVLPTAKPRIDSAVVLAQSLDRFRQRGRDASSKLDLVVVCTEPAGPKREANAPVGREAK